MTKRVTTLGEILMRLSVPGNGRFTQAESFHVAYGGSEANVTTSLAIMGVPSSHVTRLPDTDIGKSVIQHLNRYGVETQHIQFGPERMGLYFLENGSMQRPPRIVYDRFESAFAHIKPGQMNWDDVMREASWFHWTGITPAISQGAADVCAEAIAAANKYSVPVSGDINYRRNLWQYGKQAIDIMPALMKGTQYLVAGLSDIKNCTGIENATYEAACQAVMKAFPQVKKITTTERESVSASHNRIHGILWNGKNLVKSNVHNLTHIVDRVGAGDAFMAGLIYGWLKSWDDNQTLEFALAASALKHSVEGDVNQVTAEEVMTLVNGENTGRLLR
jgi:2-dehydro-3-deoxygluconokinase